MGAEALGDDGPAHEFGDGEGFEELLLVGDEGVAGVGVYAVEEVGLFVVVRGEEDVIDDSLEDLKVVSCRNRGSAQWAGLLHVAVLDSPRRIPYLGLVDSACMRPSTCLHALPT